MVVYRWLGRVTLVAILVALPPAVGQGQQILREGRIERLIICDGESAEGWSVTEATLEPSEQKARSGRSLLFHVPVDWQGGEANYPIGWPRCWFKVPEGARDWSKWERLRFWVYTETSRDTLPNVPLTLLLTTTGPKSNWSRDLSLKKGEWVEIVLPLDDVPDRDQVREVKFAISESNYAHGDIVDFYIEDFELIRYTEATVVGLEPLTRVCFADEPAVPMMVEMLGLQPEATSAVKVCLMRGDKIVAEGIAQVAMGRNLVKLSLPAGLEVGDYTLGVGTGENALTASIKLVSSPWQGGENE
jgi:hypothetical protein